MAEPIGDRRKSLSKKPQLSKPKPRLRKFSNSSGLKRRSRYNLEKAKNLANRSKGQNPGRFAKTARTFKSQ
ncbi:hypothetical protein J5X98_13555 [Leptothermofonsia sichuanensis E412]|uniref:hypothetical protein n=1 Tax=Leptothermofonsia sichuanensis TaxID=2917832 RepID=UPI001CA66D61|nr:hypothetical protein [Leptothermofonsia sichuanensis]QZZ23267.1 hypothetical protein J5X98_13555 [Leptothermofonsia sichuanensis E412]